MTIEVWDFEEPITSDRLTEMVDSINDLLTRPRVVTVTVAATPAINVDNGDVFRVGVTGDLLDLAVTSMTTNLTGTPRHGQKIIVEFLDDGTARAITWGASFRSTNVGTLPTTTVLSKLLRAGFMWDSVDSKWDCVAVASEV